MFSEFLCVFLYVLNTYFPHCLIKNGIMDCSLKVRVYKHLCDVDQFCFCYSFLKQFGDEHTGFVNWRQSSANKSNFSVYKNMVDNDCYLFGRTIHPKVTSARWQM